MEKKYYLGTSIETEIDKIDTRILRGLCLSLSVYLYHYLFDTIQIYDRLLWNRESI